MPNLPHLGLGIGWRPELALGIERRRDLGFVELLAEDFDPQVPLPQPIESLLRRGVVAIPHGVTLSLGGADPIDPHRLTNLAKLAERVDAPLVSEHLAFVRAGGRETGHLLPVPRTRESLEILVENIRLAQAVLPVPLALENIATLFEWPNPELSEAEFIHEILDRTNALLLLDVENVYANARNLGQDSISFFEGLPLDRLAYVHIAGGADGDGVYHDTHTHAVPSAVFELLSELAARTSIPGVLLERDGRFPSAEDLNLELDAIQTAIAIGNQRRLGPTLTAVRNGV